MQKLNKQFKLLKEKREKNLKKKLEYSPEKKIKKNNIEEKKEIKEYYEFEKKLNTTIKELMEREEIKILINK